MAAPTVTVIVACTGLCLAGSHLVQAQEATSSNLPDQFQTGEMIQIQKPKKKKAESNSQTLATEPKQDAAPVPEQMPAAEETPTHIAPPVEEKKAEPNRSTTEMPLSHKSATPTEQISPAEEPEAVAAPAKRKSRPRKRQRPAVEPAASISEPLPVSLSVAQSMAITAPLPEYTYEMKRRNLSGNGVCVVTVDPMTGTVTNATMFQTTGNSLLDRLTTQTFKNWRFKPGTVSRVRVPISYE